MKTTSFVIPVYRSEDCLAALVERIRASPLWTDGDCEVILVNDGSPDRSWARIVELASRVIKVRGVNLRRNFGQDCGFWFAMWQ
jgi:glycosyltransferase involved in cell wall biosynthesis